MNKIVLTCLGVAGGFLLAANLYAVAPQPQRVFPYYDELPAACAPMAFAIRRDFGVFVCNFDNNWEPLGGQVATAPLDDTTGEVQGYACFAANGKLVRSEDPCDM